MRINPISKYPVFKGDIIFNYKNDNEVKLKTEDILSIKENSPTLTHIYTHNTLYKINSPINKIASMIALSNKTGVEISLTNKATEYKFY